MTPAILAELQHRHREPHRHHHDWSRIAGMLAMAEEVPHAIGDRAAFILAILFHTAILEHGRPDNGAASAALLRHHLGTTMPAHMLARAEALIMAVTRREMPETEDASLRGDAGLLLDMDNAILGEPPARYAAYEAALRRESAHLSEDRYALGRAAALRALLWRDRLFNTDRFFLDRERRARRNIAAMLEQLEAP